MSVHNTKKAAKNTIVLYFRMILVMLVSLYTVRVVLNTLGTVDYGIYSVVGGVVLMLSFLTGTLSGACQRFFAYEIGCNDFVKLKRTFSISISTFILLAFIILIVLEVFGVWFLNHKMSIPIDRLYAANFVFQFSVLSFLVSIMLTPYNALLIAHEEMGVYAYIGILEVVLKLAVVYLLLLVSYDKLIIYSFFIFVSTLIVSFITIFYVKRKYNDITKIQLIYNKEEISPILTYAGWNIIGSIVNIIKINGTNILLNVFFGPIVNAARAISVQIGTAINSFVVNLYMAVRPQITKSYAAKEFDNFVYLIFVSSKGSYFLLLLLSLPILFETHFILNIWLEEIPEYTVILTRLFIINILVEVVTNQLYAAVLSTGHIKEYQLYYCSFLLLILPISYVLFYFNFPPQTILCVSILITILGYIPQLIITKRTANISIGLFIKKVILVCLIVSVLSSILPLTIYLLMSESALRFFLLVLASCVSCILFIYLIGLTRDERFILHKLIRKKFLNTAQ